jgi:hypothetical protein
MDPTAAITWTVVVIGILPITGKAISVLVGLFRRSG